MVEGKKSPAVRNFTFNDNKNVNYIIVRNIFQEDAININDYIPIIRKEMVPDSYSSNVNTNVIIIQNVITDKYQEPGARFENIPYEDTDKNSIQQTDNNINFVVVRNIIPLGNYIRYFR